MRPGMQSVRLVSFVVLFAACDTGPLDVGTATKEQLLFASKPVGPVTINTVIDFTAFPFEGTFAVTAGPRLNSFDWANGDPDRYWALPPDGTLAPFTVEVP